LTIDPQLVQNGAETRAAVALLTRSIQIVSGGDNAGDEFPALPSSYYFGAHMVVRQGFQKVQIQGVEFKQMGQGGRLGHYPVHFHMARQTPANTFVKDSSVNESMTRWYVIHSTQGVTLARNVGWRSIGHGYYLEDGTEANNNLYSDIGIFARAAINNGQNDRQVPGILADNQGPFTGNGDVSNPGFPYRSDNVYPTVFWISNGWNNFIGNMAAGAGACGSAY
jgi:cell migration-inducing and hyaluronan-binding protein